MNRLSAIFFKFAVGAVAVNLIWALAALLLQRPMLPAPWDVYALLPSLLTGETAMHALASFLRLTGGVAIATVAGVAVGVLMGSNRRANEWLGALVYFAYPVPKLALLPVVMLLAGIGDTAKIIMIVLILLFQIIVATRDAVQHIPQSVYEVYRSLGASRLRTLCDVTLPALLPDLLSTLRVAVGTAFSVLFVTETYGTDRGMGYFIVNSWMTIEYVQMYAGIVLLSMMGFFLFLVIDILEARFCSWKR